MTSLRSGLKRAAFYGPVLLLTPAIDLAQRRAESARSVFLIRMKTVAIAASQGQSARLGRRLMGEQHEQTRAQRTPRRQERRNQQRVRRHTRSHAAQDLR